MPTNKKNVKKYMIAAALINAKKYLEEVNAKSDEISAQCDLISAGILTKSGKLAS